MNKLWTSVFGAPRAARRCSQCGDAAATIAAAGRAVATAFVRREELGDVHGVAAPLMAALGATFAALTAIALSCEAGYPKAPADHSEQMI